MKATVIVMVLLVLFSVDFFEFHDLFEEKTLPQYLTGIVSIPIAILLLSDLNKNLIGLQI